jgi:hypothetical protein
MMTEWADVGSVFYQQALVDFGRELAPGMPIGT